MIEMIATLIAKGLAYQADDKSVYFRLNKFPDYGKLAHFNLDELRSTGRVKQRRIRQGTHRRFRAVESVGRRRRRCEMGFAVGTGPARLAHRVQRDGDGAARASRSTSTAAAWTTFSRITKRRSRRANACTGKKFVRYWLHCAHLMVDGQKMAKSLGNFYTLRDVLAKGYTGRELRYALLTVNYRLPLNFTWEGMNEARESLGRIDDWLARLREVAKSKRRRPNAPRPTPNHSVRRRAG